METLKVTHENCGGNLIHRYNRLAIKRNEIVKLEVYQCDTCHRIVNHEVEQAEPKFTHLCCPQTGA